MANLPTRTTADVAADHVADHNTLHTFHNLIDAAGDLIVGTGVDTAGRLAKGTAMHGLRVNSGGTALEYGLDSAANTTFTPAGTIAASTVQAALEEVATDAAAEFLSKTTDGSLADGVDVAVGTSTGSKIGTGATQKLGFYGATPVVQPAANADTSGATLGDLETEVNQLKALLRSLGLLAT